MISITCFQSHDEWSARPLNVSLSQLIIKQMEYGGIYVQSHKAQAKLQHV